MTEKDVRKKENKNKNGFTVTRSKGFNKQEAILTLSLLLSTAT